MEKTVFHLPEDSPFEVMEELARRNPKVTEEEKLRGALILEETYLRLEKGMNHTDLSAAVTIRKRFGDISVELMARGEAVNPILSLTEWVDDEADLYSVNVLKANRDRMGYARRNGANVVSILVHEGGVKGLYLTVIGIAAGVVLGWGMKMALSAATIQWLEENVTAPVEAMFMHAMMMMAAPLIFFAIIGGVTNMSETADIGKLGVRLIVQSVALVMLSAVLNVGIGQFFFPGDMTYMAGFFESAKGGVPPSDFSLVRLIVDVVPSNLVEPFQGKNLLQVLFLAIFFGIVVNRLGEKARIAKEIIEFMNSFCLSVMGILVGVVPMIVCVAMMGMMIRTDAATLFGMGRIIWGTLLMTPLSFLLFAAVLALYGKMPPTVFLRKMLAFTPVPMALRSSNAALPQTIRLVTEGFGVSPSLASFALPMGVQLHQAGTCTAMALPAVMMAKVFDKPFTAEFLLCLTLYVFFFTYTMPPVPGAGIVAMSSVFSAIGVPPEALVVFLCVDPILDMFETPTNVSCNVVSSLLLAKKFDMWDEKIYRKE